MDIKDLDFDSLKEDERLAVAENAYAALYNIDKSDFINDCLSDTSDRNIEDYYNDYIRQDDDNNEADYEEEDSFDPDTAEDPSRCWMMKQFLRAFNHSRIDPTREEAMETVKQMYDYMGWK